MTNTMQERFDKKFKCIDSRCCDGQGNIPYQVSEDEWESQQCQFHAEYLFPLKDFIQSEIDLAVAKKEKEIVEKIQGLIDEYSHIAKYDEVGGLIINVITTK